MQSQCIVLILVLVEHTLGDLVILRGSQKLDMS